MIEAPPAAAEAPSHSGSLGALGDPWSLLIVQEAFFGVRRFEDFQRNLGISRKTLSQRLARLTSFGLLSKQAYLYNPLRYDYRLTNASLDSYPYALCLLRWGDQWLAGKEGPPVTLRHIPCGKILQPVAVCSCCRRKIRAEDVAIKAGSAIYPLAESGAQLRCSPRQELYTAGRTSSVGRAVALIGDRWGFFILWLALAGISRFEDICKTLGIARTVLASRLERLLLDGVLERDLYCQRPPRYEYRLTAKGRSLCPALLAMYDWGVRWSGAAAAHSRVLHRTCGRPLRTEVICSHCSAPLVAHEVEVIGSSRTA